MGAAAEEVVALAVPPGVVIVGATIVELVLTDTDVTVGAVVGPPAVKQKLITGEKAGNRAVLL
jgi:hypothetical protein